MMPHCACAFVASDLFAGPYPLHTPSLFGDSGANMLGERYVVRKGDSLWRIAERKLGSGTQWTRIWKYNNRAEVSRATGRKIPNPDLIYIGQVILIPTVP